jgi:pimeloyl-ACP methyl ester carboxylesterase
MFGVIAAFASSTASAAPLLYIECSGTGSPVVVLEAGANRTSTSWAKVIPAVAKFTRVCAYDRAGSGRSVSKPSRLVQHTALSDAHALHDLLDAAGERPPYLLVGHSYGALVVRQFAATFRQDVVGVIFVDSPHEDYAIELAKLTHEPLPTYPPEGPIDWPTTFSEMRRISTLGDVPLTVLTAGEVPDGVSAAEAALSLRLQLRLAKLSSRGKQRTARNAGHMIPIEAPTEIVGSVREMVEAARRGG